MIILVICCALLTIGCAISGARFLQFRKSGEHRAAFKCKGIAGICFLAVGVLMALYKGSTSAFWITAGLFCGLVGDQLLALRKVWPQRHDLYFCSGAVCFSIGHIFYILAIAQFLTLPLYGALPAFAVLMILSMLSMFLCKVDAGKMRMLSILYVAIVAFVCSCGLCALIQSPTLGTGLLFLGSLSFLMSDNLLVVQTFSAHKTRPFNIFLHITYYLAQLLMGWSILFL